MIINFPCGLEYKNFINISTCDELVYELDSAEWIPALIARYDGNDLLKIEHDSARSTAQVTKGFRFKKNNFVEELKEQIRKLIKDRFELSITKFSDYGVSRYPIGSKLSLHADTGAYNTNRLITCILYLKTPKKGGVLSFPEVNVNIQVEKGSLICFYSELKHLVTPIVEGERVAVVFFGE